MTDLLRDPFWQFAGAALTFAALLISVASLRRRRKALTYNVLSQVPLVRASPGAGNLQILFEGNPVWGVHLLEVRFANSGGVPIVPNDYMRPVLVSFGPEAQVLTVEVRQTPQNLGVSLINHALGVTIEPVMLNPGDAFTIKALVSQFKGPVSVDGRIMGVRSIRRFVPEEAPERLYSASIIITVAALVVVLAAAIFRSLSLATAALIIEAAGLVGTVSSFLWWMRRRAPL